MAQQHGGSVRSNVHSRLVYLPTTAATAGTADDLRSVLSRRRHEPAAADDFGVYTNTNTTNGDGGPTDLSLPRRHHPHDHMLHNAEGSSYQEEEGEIVSAMDIIPATEMIRPPPPSLAMANDIARLASSSEPAQRHDHYIMPPDSRRTSYPPSNTVEPSQRGSVGRRRQLAYRAQADGVLVLSAHQPVAIPSDPNEPALRSSSFRDGHDVVNHYDTHGPHVAAVPPLEYNTHHGDTWATTPSYSMYKDDFVTSANNIPPPPVHSFPPASVPLDTRRWSSEIQAPAYETVSATFPPPPTLFSPTMPHVVPANMSHSVPSNDMAPSIVPGRKRPIGAFRPTMMAQPKQHYTGDSHAPPPPLKRSRSDDFVSEGTDRYQQRAQYPHDLSGHRFSQEPVHNSDQAVSSSSWTKRSQTQDENANAIFSQVTGKVTSTHSQDSCASFTSPGQGKPDYSASTVDDIDHYDDENVPVPPQPWSIQVSRSRNRRYYYNPITKKSVWPFTEEADRLLHSFNPDTGSPIGVSEDTTKPEDTTGTTNATEGSPLRLAIEDSLGNISPRTFSGMSFADIEQQFMTDTDASVALDHESVIAPLHVDISGKSHSARKAAALKMLAPWLNPSLCANLGIILTLEDLQPLRHEQSRGDTTCNIQMALLQSVAMHKDAQPLAAFNHAVLARYLVSVQFSQCVSSAYTERAVDMLRQRLVDPGSSPSTDALLSRWSSPIVPTLTASTAARRASLLSICAQMLGN